MCEFREEVEGFLFDVDRQSCLMKLKLFFLSFPRSLSLPLLRTSSSGPRRPRHRRQARPAPGAAGSPWRRKRPCKRIENCRKTRRRTKKSEGHSLSLRVSTPRSGTSGHASGGEVSAEGCMNSSYSLQLPGYADIVSLLFF